MQSALPLAIFLVMAVAGCAEDSDPIDPAMTDSDGDGYMDAVETEAGTDPDNATSFPAPQRIEEAITFSGAGTILVGNEDPLAGCATLDVPDTVVLTWDISAPDNATSVRVTDMSFTATYPASMPEGDIFVFDPAGNGITASTAAAIPPQSTDTVTAPGPHGAGAYRIEIRGCVGSGDITLAASATLSYLV
jgi:hypothetical protein